MLTEIYIEVLLVDEELADQVQGAWACGRLSNEVAAIAWLLVAVRCLSRVFVLIK